MPDFNPDAPPRAESSREGASSPSRIGAIATGTSIDAIAQIAVAPNSFKSYNSTTWCLLATTIVVRIGFLCVLFGISHFIGTLPPQSLVADALTILVLVIGAFVGLYISTSWDRSISRLKNTVIREERLSADAVDRYRPAVMARVDDIAAPIVDIFARIPGVVQVEARIVVEKPTHRIIHLRDMHFVPRHIVSLELRQSLGREPTSRECEQTCQQERLEVERVQLEQLAILRCLIRHHGLTKVFKEGMLVEDHDIWRAWIAEMKDAYSVGPQDVSQLKVSERTNEGAARRRKELSPGDKMRPSRLVNSNEPGLAELGAALYLAIRGELVDICPLDDITLLEANPVSATGEVQHDYAKIKARNDAQINCLTKEEGVAVVILGGAHELSESIQRLAGGHCEYIRVTSEKYREMCPSGIGL